MDGGPARPAQLFLQIGRDGGCCVFERILFVGDAAYRRVGDGFGEMGLVDLQEGERVAAANRRRSRPLLLT